MAAFTQQPAGRASCDAYSGRHQPIDAFPKESFDEAELLASRDFTSDSCIEDLCLPLLVPEGMLRLPASPVDSRVRR